MNADLRIRFGYPVHCTECDLFDDKPLNLQRINPYYKSGNSTRVMLIGQDPTIFDRPDRVNEVLMLKETRGRNGQLRRWIENELFGKEKFEKIELYSTNLVKCQFSKPPSTNGALKFLEPRFKKCKKYLLDEIENFKPTVVLTFGEPAHILFSKELTIIKGNLNEKMKEDFNGSFFRASLNNIEFDYSPCLHIKTFRVAETYGEKVIQFKKELRKY